MESRRRKEWARLAGLIQLRNYDSQKSMGVVRLRFSAGGSLNGVVGGSEQPSPSLSREYRAISLASDPLSWSANARDSNLRGCRYPSLSAHGLYRTMLRAAEEFNLNYSNVRYIRGMYGFSMFFFLSSNSFAFKRCESCTFSYKKPVVYTLPFLNFSHSCTTAQCSLRVRALGWERSGY